jgi:hypothetical protein
MGVWVVEFVAELEGDSDIFLDGLDGPVDESKCVRPLKRSSSVGVNELVSCD